MEAYEEPYEALQQKFESLRRFYHFLPEESNKLGCHSKLHLP